MKIKTDYLQHCLADHSAEVMAGKGKNIIPPPEREPLWRAYLEKFKDPLIIVLLVVFVFSMGVSCYETFVLGKGHAVLMEPMGVLVALLLATGVGFIFEVKAEREFEVLNTVKNLRPVKVYRRADDGQVRVCQVEKQDVVVGDYVFLESGDEIPADGTLCKSITLTIDESNFTGEPFAHKTTDVASAKSDTTYPVNFLLRGSTVIEGNAVMRVTAIGLDTEEGRGVKRTQEGSDVQTPLNQQLDHLGRLISKVSFVIAALIVVGRMVYYFFFDGDPSNHLDVVQVIEFALASVMLAVTLIVVAVPEGLPMSITVSLALSMRKMLKENNLVRKLHACETMGAATVICTDKTGTLTQNKMTVVDACLGEDCEARVIEDIAYNSTAQLSYDDNQRLRTLGNPTEGALLMWLKETHDIDYRPMRAQMHIVEQVPFSTERKYMSTTVAGADERHQVRYVKGAPEVVMAMCDEIGGGRSEEDYQKMLSDYQSRAMRTLGFACQEVADGQAGAMRFLGVVGIADPVREDVREAIETCTHRAGVRVIIVTGDTPGTAMEIGRQVGLVSAGDGTIVTTGPAFAALSDEEALRLVADRRLKIVSRARPDDKARLVTLLQRLGEVVAVTGDGTNDAPALSKAQVGLSMGDGTARAKEASDITIIDNSFSSINKAIMWGRSLYLNIQRFILYQMTINVCACLIVLYGTFTGLDSPLTVTQMLWVNLIMDTFAAGALSSLPADHRVLNSKPRPPRSHIIDRRMGWHTLWVSMIFFVLLLGLWQLLWHGNASSVADVFSSEHLRDLANGFFSHKNKSHLSGYERGVFFTTFVLMQFWNLFNARYFRTGRSLMRDLVGAAHGRRRLSDIFSRGFLLVAVVILLGQVAIVTFAGGMFNVEPLHVTDWLWLLLCTSPILIVGEVIRNLTHHRRITRPSVT